MDVAKASELALRCEVLQGMRNEIILPWINEGIEPTPDQWDDLRKIEIKLASTRDELNEVMDLTDV